MAKMKYWNGTTWEILDAKDADTLDGKHYSDIKNEIEIKYAVASGTNSYTVSIPGITTLVEGLSVKIKFTNANTGASTLDINGLGAKEIRKSNGNALLGGNIKAGQILHLVYNGVNFQLLGEGGEGTARPEHVLEGYTFTNDNNTFEGTMPNQGRMIITPGTTNIAIPQGYHDGTGYVVGSANLKPENIKEGVNIFGKVGNYGPKILEGTLTSTIYFVSQSAYDKAHLVEFNGINFNNVLVMKINGTYSGRPDYRNWYNNLLYVKYPTPRYNVAGSTYGSNDVSIWDNSDTQGWEVGRVVTNSNITQDGGAPYINASQQTYVQFQIYENGFHWYPYMCDEYRTEPMEFKYRMIMIE